MIDPKDLKELERCAETIAQSVDVDTRAEYRALLLEGLKAVYMMGAQSAAKRYDK